MFPITCTTSSQVPAQSQHIQLPIQYYNNFYEYSSMLQNSVLFYAFNYGTLPGTSLHSLHLHCGCILCFKQIVFLQLRRVFAISTTLSLSSAVLSLWSSPSATPAFEGESIFC